MLSLALLLEVQLVFIDVLPPPFIQFQVLSRTLARQARDLRAAGLLLLRRAGRNHTVTQSRRLVRELKLEGLATVPGHPLLPTLKA